MHRRRFLQLMTAVLAATSLGGCSPSEPLRIGVHPWIGYESLYLAEEFGWLADRLQLVKQHAASHSIEGLIAGDLDAAALTLDEALRVRGAGVPVRIVTVTDVSVGADVLLVRPGIDHLTDLPGRRVAVELDAVSGVMLFAVLDAAGLGTDDISVVDMPVNEHAEAWRRGIIDASVNYEPEASRLEAMGAIRLFDSSQLPETIFDVLVVTEEAAESRPDAIRALVRAHFLGLQHMVRNLHDSVYRIASRQDISPALVRQSMATVMLPELSANHRYLARNGRLNLVANQLEIVLLREGLMKARSDVRPVADASFLPRSLP